MDDTSEDTTTTTESKDTTTEEKSEDTSEEESSSDTSEETTEATVTVAPHPETTPAQTTGTETTLQSDENGEWVNGFYFQVVEGQQIQTHFTQEDLNNIGINLNEIEFNMHFTVRVSRPVNAQNYKLVSNNSPFAGEAGYLTEYEYNLLIAQVAHEAGNVSKTNCYGVASAILNLSENQYNGDIVKCINNSCVKFESTTDSIYTNYISIEDGTLYTDKRGKQLAIAKLAVDVAISGTRAFSSEVRFWVGNGHYNRFSTTYKESSNF